ncbi:MAG: class I SAM-dependent methyltransferase [Selenomonadaceae bacterium]|nr:class I SAM-dependent methyltransferase [Selenomonadaceae bacterium]
MQTEKNLEKRIENYWDERSGEFGKVRRLELSGENYFAWEKIIIEHLPKKENLKILDVGTGAGFFAVIFSKLGHKVIGVDMSSKMLKEAEKIFAEFNLSAEFLKMDAQNLKFPNETFDVVISRNLTWTLPDAMQAYREWKRVLKIGGILMNFDSDCGQTTFEKKSDLNDVHKNISENLIAECNAIKNSLRISTHRRPIWDVELLKKLEFEVEFEKDISKIVHKDSNCRYDSIPLFAIYAKKFFNEK